MVFGERHAAEAVEVVFAIPTHFNDRGFAEQCEVVADGGLALFKQFAEVADVQFGHRGKVVDDLQPSAIGQQFEQFHEFVGRVFRKRWHRRSLLALETRTSGRFSYRRDHGYLGELDAPPPTMPSTKPLGAPSGEST